MCMCIILCGVDVIIFNAIERYVSCVMVVRVGPRSMAVDGCMLVPVCIVYLCVGYVCRNMCMMLCVLYFLCAYVHAYVRICMWCEHMCLVICMWWCCFDMDDGVLVLD